MIPAPEKHAGKGSAPRLGGRVLGRSQHEDAEFLLLQGISLESSSAHLCPNVRVASRQYSLSPTVTTLFYTYVLFTSFSSAH